jgi:hypothetical protein
MESVLDQKAERGRYRTGPEPEIPDRRQRSSE